VTATLLVTGDMLPMRTPIADGAAFREVCERVRSADLALGTLDMSLTTRGYPVEKIVAVRTAPRVAHELHEMGFDVMSLANNHAMDYGEVGLFDTLAALRAVGIACVGAERDVGAASAPVIRTLNRSRIALFGWSCLLPTGASASPERPGVAPLHVQVSYEIDPYVQMEEPTFPPTIRSRVDEADLRAAIGRIEAARDDCDFVVVLVHWGVGDSDELSEYQRPLAHALVDAGADLVVGSHPHCVHGIELYRDRAILYSPGTLIDQLPRDGVSPDVADFMTRMSPDAYVASADVESDGTYALRITPVTQAPDGSPVIARGEACERIAARLTRMSLALGTELAAVDGDTALFLTCKDSAKAGSS
jgi:poly-gamma-glutamate capsule biosynthesis protein CapA/YwtB (metallophosphatase superfamily)